MKSINYSTGVKSYAVNGDGGNVITINVADYNLAKRIYDAQSELDAIIAKYKDMDESTLDTKQLAELMYSIDRDIRETMNKAFSTDVCTPAFGTANCMSPVDADGTPLYQAFFEAFMPMVKADIEAMRPQQHKVRPEVEHYLKPASAPVVRAMPQSKPLAGLAQPYRESLDISRLSKEDKALLIAQLLE